MADASREEKLKAARETVQIILVLVLIIPVQTIAEKEGWWKDCRSKGKEAKRRST
jgi:hypothetical protein